MKTKISCNSCQCYLQTPGIVSAEDYRSFWIQTALVEEGLELKIGKAGESVPIMTGLDKNPVEIKYLGLASWYGVNASYINVKPGNIRILIHIT